MHAAGPCRNPFLFRAAVLACNHETVGENFGRNPFLFRAAVLAGPVRAAMAALHVVIPSCSGLRFSQKDAGFSTERVSRNPFLFRAAVLARSFARSASLCRRNPFLFRAAVLASRNGRFAIARRRNPFLFRAAVLASAIETAVRHLVS